MVFHSEAKEKVITELQSNPELGLSQEQVSAKRAEYGENKLRENKKKIKE